VRWIEDWIRPDEVLYDIGANVGAYSLVAALSPSVRARVVAVEPGYPTFAALSDNVVRNGAQDRVTALGVALGRATTLETSTCARSMRVRPFTRSVVTKARAAPSTASPS
jgi:FkbM family methyltransferase